MSSNEITQNRLKTIGSDEFYYKEGTSSMVNGNRDSAQDNETVKQPAPSTNYPNSTANEIKTSKSFIKIFREFINSDIAIADNDIINLLLIDRFEIHHAEVDKPFPLFLSRFIYDSVNDDPE